MFTEFAKHLIHGLFLLDTSLGEYFARMRREHGSPSWKLSKYVVLCFHLTGVTGVAE